MPSTNPRQEFLTIPPEIREHIYGYLLHPSNNRCFEEDEYTWYDFKRSLVLFNLNRQIYIESHKVFHQLNTFVRVETPWPQAKDHVTREGHVPILVSDEKAVRFEHWTLGVSIEAPGTSIETAEMQHFVIHLDDVEKFTQMWFYANLSHPELNPHLKLTLKLRHPFHTIEKERRILLSLQERLILPFGAVQDLKVTAFSEDMKPDQSVITRLRDLQKQPSRSPEQCLLEAARLKKAGNDSMRSGRYAEALGHYKEAWKAMHVIISGRQRHIHAEAYFDRILQEPPLTGKNGRSERLVLRVHLVANTCLAYLNLEDWLECRFWGERSINMLREAIGADTGREISPEQEAVLGFPAADQMGKIYYRTALACKHMGDLPEARRLLKVAKVYLPHDTSIGRAQASVALRM